MRGKDNFLIIWFMRRRMKTEHWQICQNQTAESHTSAMSHDGVKVDPPNRPIINKEFCCKPTVLNNFGDMSTYHMLMPSTQQSYFITNRTT